MNESENTAYQNLGDIMKAVLGGKLITLCAYTKIFHIGIGKNAQTGRKEHKQRYSK